MISNSLFRWCFVWVGVASVSVGACGGGDDDDDSGGSANAGNGGASKGGTGGRGGTTAKGGTTSKGGSSGTSPQGVCQPTCAKECDADNDCATSQGELCCDFGEAGKICTFANACPRKCEDDSGCSTRNGEACQTVTLSAPKECLSAGAGLRTCENGDDCGAGEVCCGNYGQGICVSPGYCPASCTATSECNATAGETCCKTVGSVEPSLVVDGLCLNTTYEVCPRACDTSTDCQTSLGETCCNGLCATYCPKSCTQSSDCTSSDARICCTSASARIPPPTHLFLAGPSCQGTAYSCEAIGAMWGTNYCTSLTGCSPSEMPCTGTPYTCNYSDSNQAECDGRPGCSYDDETGYCDGTPKPCVGAATSTECYANVGCGWFPGKGTCTGDATPCALLSLTNCTANPGCYVGKAF